MLKQHRQQYKVIQSQSKSLERKADTLLNGKRRKTRRGKKKKISQNPERVRLFNIAMEEHKKMKRELVTQTK